VCLHRCRKAPAVPDLLPVVSGVRTDSADSALAPHCPHHHRPPPPSRKRPGKHPTRLPSRLLTAFRGGTNIQCVRGVREVKMLLVVTQGRSGRLKRDARAEVSAQMLLQSSRMSLSQVFRFPALAATLWFGMPCILIFVLPHSSTIIIFLLLCVCRKAAFTRLIMRQGPRELRHHQRRGARQLQSLRYASKDTALCIASQPIVGDVNVPCQHQLVARWRGRFPIAALRSTACATRPCSSSEFAAASRDVNAL